MPHTPAVHRTTTDVAPPIGVGRGQTAVKASQCTRVGLSSVAAIGIMFLLAYVGSTTWHLIHLGDFDFTPLLLAATLPLPFKGQTIPCWVEVA